jgi:16S rRNA (cytosine967-C5)-methyltransferase
VLLDAPCSSTGTLRRHPDIAWLKDSAQIASLTAAQDRLLAHAVAMLKPGGLLVYAVCSLQAEEGPQRIHALLSSDNRIERLPLTSGDLPGLPEAITPEGDLRSLPCHWAAQGGMDGFYACRLRHR